MQREKGSGSTLARNRPKRFWFDVDAFFFILLRNGTRSSVLHACSFLRLIEVAEQSNSTREGSHGASMEPERTKTVQQRGDLGVAAEIPSSFFFFSALFLLPYLGRAVATAGDAAHRLACRTGVATIAAAAEARVAVVFVVAAEGVAARREARMMEGERGVLEERRRKKERKKEKNRSENKRAWSALVLCRRRRRSLSSPAAAAAFISFFLFSDLVRFLSSLSLLHFEGRE